jgi:hypothetical protein
MATDWINHTPGDCPVSPDTVVEAVLEDGHQLTPMRADELDWYCPGDDVVKYRVVKPH